MTDKPADTRVLVNLSPPSDPTPDPTTTTDSTTVSSTDSTTDTTSTPSDSSSGDSDSSESDHLRGSEDRRSVASFLDVLPNLRASKDKRKAENRLSALLMGGVTDTFTDSTDAADMEWPDAYQASVVLVSKWNLEDEQLEVGTDQSGSTGP